MQARRRVGASRRLAEAGFFPGIIFFLTLWYPAIYRGRIIGAFMAAIPLSSAIGSPVSGMILGTGRPRRPARLAMAVHHRSGAAIILGVATYFYLTDRPADAAWLADDERAWLSNRLEAERRQREAAHQISVVQALFNPRVLALALVYFGLVACIYGVGFWLPQIVKQFGLSIAMTGWVTALIASLAVVAIGVVLALGHDQALKKAPRLRSDEGYCGFVGCDFVDCGLTGGVTSMPRKPSRAINRATMPSALACFDKIGDISRAGRHGLWGQSPPTTSWRRRPSGHASAALAPKARAAPSAARHRH